MTNIDLEQVFALNGLKNVNKINKRCLGVIRHGMNTAKGGVQSLT